MTRSGHILEAARSIRPELTQLLGPEEAEKVDRELVELLAEANAGRIDDSDKRVLCLLGQHDSTLEWVSEYLRARSPKGDEKVQGTRGYAALPGEMTPIARVQYRCPQNDYVWRRRTVGAAIPVCPTHQAKLAAGRLDFGTENSRRQMSAAT
jgi:hypothetical protein